MQQQLVHQAPRIIFLHLASSPFQFQRNGDKSQVACVQSHTPSPPPWEPIVSLRGCHTRLRFQPAHDAWWLVLDVWGWPIKVKVKHCICHHIYVEYDACIIVRSSLETDLPPGQGTNESLTPSISKRMTITKRRTEKTGREQLQQSSYY